jgi:hypothetical protein
LILRPQGTIPHENDPVRRGAVVGGVAGAVVGSRHHARAVHHSRAWHRHHPAH